MMPYPPKKSWMKHGHGVLVTLFMGIAFGMGGCDSAPREDLEKWATDEFNKVPPGAKPIEPPKSFEPKTYDSGRGADPFGAERTALALRNADGSASTQAKSSVLLSGEKNRRKEPLEGFTLEEMSMVGILQKSGQKIALIKVAGLIYQVREGGYIGSNYGKVKRITESQIELREIVQDATGEWTERPATLQLQEGSSP